MVELAEPETLADAVEIVHNNEGEAKYLAGGTALVLLVRMKLLDPKVLVSLRGIRDLEGWHAITSNNDHVVIGGGVTLSEVAKHPLVLQYIPSLAHAARVVGNARIRNAATLGGLMAEADYASDPPATLVSLQASIVLSSGSHEREMPVHEFITDFFTTQLEPEEVVARIRVPIASAMRRSIYQKFSSRSAEDRPCVGVAVSADFDDGCTIGDLRIVIGAIAGQPQSFPDITRAFVGGTLSGKNIDSIADAYANAIDPIEDSRGTEWYRRQVVRAQVARALTTISVGKA